VRANLPSEVVEIDGRIRIDLDGQRLWVNNEEEQWQQVHLQRLQFELLHALVVNAGLIMPSTTLKDRVWGKDVSDGVLAVYIRRLREKLEPDPHHPIYIEAIRGVGYRFNGRPVRARSPEPGRRCDHA
jgi:DNA-binding response OmpR family regulator